MLGRWKVMILCSQHEPSWGMCCLCLGSKDSTAKDSENGWYIRSCLSPRAPQTTVLPELNKGLPVPPPVLRCHHLNCVGSQATMNSTFGNHFQPGLQPDPLTPWPWPTNPKASWGQIQALFLQRRFEKENCVELEDTARSYVPLWWDHAMRQPPGWQKREALQIPVTWSVSSRVI